MFVVVAVVVCLCFFFLFHMHGFQTAHHFILRKARHESLLGTLSLEFNSIFSLDIFGTQEPEALERNHHCDSLFTFQ